MATEKAPAFQFYPKDFLTDENVVAMSNTEVGIYVRLMCYCWLEGTLPLDTNRLARMAHMPIKQFTRMWENTIVRSCFTVEDDGRMHHPRLDAEREKQDQFRRRQSDHGKKGGRPSGKGLAFSGLSQTKAKKSSSISNLLSPISRKRNPPGEPVGFQVFWAHYPRKVGKDAALREWQNLNPDESLREIMLLALEWQVQQESWQLTEFIPHPRTWLHQGRWKDEPPTHKPPQRLEPTARATWVCPHEPPCTSTEFYCHQRTTLEAGRKGLVGV